ncbi:4515_t:CDS:2, partial [Gigaspora margarita]
YPNRDRAIGTASTLIQALKLKKHIWLNKKKLTHKQEKEKEKVEGNKKAARKKPTKLVEPPIMTKIQPYLIMTDLQKNDKESEDESTDSEEESETEVSEDEKEYKEEEKLISQIYLYCKFYPSKLDTYKVRKFCMYKGHNESKCILKKGIEMQKAYLDKEKGAQVEKYNLGEMSQEQQGRIRQILQKYENIFMTEVLSDVKARTQIHWLRNKKDGGSQIDTPIQYYSLPRINELLGALKSSACVYYEIWALQICSNTIWVNQCARYILAAYGLCFSKENMGFHTDQNIIFGHEILGLEIIVAESKVAA